MPVLPIRLHLPLGLAALLLLSACGQKGPLYLPQEPAAAERATLPQSVFRPVPRSDTQEATQP